jgi:processing peptidase subunit alpha
VGGIKAAAVDSAGPICSVGVFVAGGSSSETPATVGAAKLLEFAAFMATANRTTFRWGPQPETVIAIQLQQH